MERRPWECSRRPWRSSHSWGSDRLRDDPVGTRAGEERTIAGIKLCWCPPGRFTMGSPPERAGAAAGRGPGRGDADPRLLDRQVRGDAGRLEADRRQAAGQADGGAARGGRLPGRQRQLRRGGGVLPQARPSWRSQSSELPEGWEFRLPTEAQWEYACRAGTTTATAFGDSLSSKQANFKGKPYNGGADEGPSLGKAAKVGSYPPNAWGIHDMHGNTFEWCRDWYHAKLPGGDDPDLYEAKATTPRNRTARSRGRGGAARGPTTAGLPVGLPPAVRAGAALRPHRLPGRGGEKISDGTSVDAAPASLTSWPPSASSIRRRNPQDCATTTCPSSRACPRCRTPASGPRIPPRPSP